MAYNLHVKKKPPFHTMIDNWIAAVSCTLLMICHRTYTQSNNTSNWVDLEEIPATDQIVTNAEPTYHSIKFSLKEPDLYEYESITCKSVNTNQVVIANEDHICQNLESCMTYLVLLNVKTINSSAPATETTAEVQTLYKKPIVNTLRTKPYPDSIMLRWYASFTTCISKIEVEAKAVGKVYKWTLTNEAKHLLMAQLKPCQEHDISFKVYDIKQRLVYHRTVSENTLYTEPGEISLNFTKHVNTQIKVQWEPPNYSSCVKRYILQWSRRDCLDSQPKIVERTTNNSSLAIPLCGNSVDITESESTEYIIDDLQGCETYDIRMFINNNTTPKVTSFFNSPLQTPGDINGTRIIPEITAVGVTWEKPEVHPNCVGMYYVKIVGPTQRSNPKTYTSAVRQTNTTFINLDPCGLYNLSIEVLSHRWINGPTWNSTFETLEGKPSKILNVSITPYPYALYISWDPPKFGDLCVERYRFSGWDDYDKPVPALDQFSQNNSILVEGLFSCQAYTLQVIPATKNNTMDGELVHIHVQTASKEPATPDIEVISIDSNRIVFSAQESDADNKCEGIFARFICETRAEARIKVAEKYVESHLGILYDAEMFPLSPFTEYACSVSIYNVAGWSPNKTVIKTTELYYPEQPRRVNVKLNTNSSLEFTWLAPQFGNGIIKIYIAHLKRIEAAYFISDDCSPITNEVTVRETSSLELLFNDLLPFTRYSFQVAATNEYGIGDYTNSYIVVTKPWVSEPISNLKTSPEGPFESDLVYKSNVLLTWQQPCRSNGEIEGFYLVFYGDRPGYQSLNFSRMVAPNFSQTDVFLYNETNLSPEYNYTVSISVKTWGVNILSVAVKDYFDAPAGIPQRLDMETVENSKIEPQPDSNPAKIVVVRIPAHILVSTSGAIIYLALLLSQKNCGKDPQLKFGALNTNIEWPDSRSWNEVYEVENTDCIQQYQTTPLRWKPKIANRKRMDSPNMVEFVIGTEDCKKSSNRYCNGPLQPDTEYNLIIRLFTKSGYNDVAILDFRTEALIDLVTIVVSITCVFLFAFVAGLIYFWIKKRIRWQRESCLGIEDSFGDTVPKNFFNFFNEISRPEKLAREFKDLSAVASDLSYSASEMGNHKNRYADIYPYDKNRVILDIDSDGSDYINASFIDGYSYRKEYIATQGPKAESTKDFWRMVLQHNVRVVVMVTQFREGDVTKCHKYFPFSFKGIGVTVKKKDSFDLYDRTELSVTHETFGLKQKVVHFYFKKWPDHGCPTDPMQLITFVRKVKAEKIPCYSPTVVHCSAGVGRTGTFIGLDIIMQRLKNESRINIYETVKKLRFQRMKMVQTLAQYTFLYMCAYELVKSKYNRPGKGHQSRDGDNESDANARQHQSTLNARQSNSDTLPRVSSESHPHSSTHYNSTYTRKTHSWNFSKVNNSIADEQMPPSNDKYFKESAL